MAGLLDQYVFTGNQLALEMVIAEAAWVEGYVNNVVAVNGSAHWLEMLNNEFGGMSEVLVNLYGVSDNPRHLRSSAGVQLG